MTHADTLWRAPSDLPDLIQCTEVDPPYHVSLPCWAYDADGDVFLVKLFDDPIWRWAPLRWVRIDAAAARKPWNVTKTILGWMPATGGAMPFAPVSRKQKAEAAL